MRDISKPYLHMMFNSLFLAIPNHWSILVIVLLVLLLFGGKKIPELMRGLGRGVKEFKEGTKEAEESLKETETEKQIKE